MRNDRGGKLPSWSSWCYLPMAGWYAIVSSAHKVDRLSLEQVIDVGRLGAVGAWRVGQGIYRFDETLYQSLMSTPIKGEIPCSVLYFLPEWCVYIETPNTKLGESVLHGFYVHLEEDANDKRHELRFCFDFDDMLLPFPIHIGQWSLEEAISRMVAEAKKQGMPDLGTRLSETLEPYIEPFLSVVLYLCSKSADYGGGAGPGRPRPTKTKQGFRIFPPDAPHIWNVGVRIGSFIRSSDSEQEGREGRHSGVRPHIRRAHWHLYYHGEKRIQAQIKWLPPIPVNVHEDTAEVLPAVIKSIKKH